MSMRYTQLHTPIGPLTILSDGKYITGITVDGPPSDGLRHDDLPVLIGAKQWLCRYFAGVAPDPECLPLKPEGTEFQRLVWSMLRQIPYGRSVSYGDLAKKAASALGKSRMSAQAIGNAVGKNPILIAIPCHRVLGASGNLTGFSAGLERKIELLRLEQIPFKE